MFRSPVLVQPTQRRSPVRAGRTALCRRVRDDGVFLSALPGAVLGHDRGGGSATQQPVLPVLGSGRGRSAAHATLHGGGLYRVQGKDVSPWHAHAGGSPIPLGKRERMLRGPTRGPARWKRRVIPGSRQGR